MVFDHYTPAQSQGRSSDGVLWTRLALSRNGVDFSYVSRAPYVERGLGRHRPNNTGVFDGALDAARSIVMAGQLETPDETWLYETGSQITHQGIVPHSWTPVAGGPWRSGVLRLRLRKNGWVSLGTRSFEWTDPPAMLHTIPMARPACGNGQELGLRLNAQVASGGSVRVGLLDADETPLPGYALEACVPVTANDVDVPVAWHAPGPTADTAEGEQSGQDAKEEEAAGDVRLQIEMRAADLYSFELVCAPREEVHPAEKDLLCQ